MTRWILTLAFLTVATTSSAQDVPRFEFDLEGAAVWQSKNDVQIPNEPSATRFSIVDLVGNGPVAAGRLTLRWNLNDRHQLHALAAPLQLVESGTPDSEISFAGETFAAGREAEATFRFNSWRVGYRYRVVSGPRGDAWIGFTAKVRDAEVKLEQDGLSANDTDLGFVPLLHLAGRRFFTDTISGSLEIEALGGGPGRAIDGAAMLRYGRRHDWGVSLGYRTIEGGADVDAVYSFAWLHYAVVAVDVPLR